jgi:hypothetical protein
MLKGQVKIKPTMKGKSYEAHDHLRLAFSFGEGLIFTGAIKGEDTVYKCGETYTVDFVTVDDDEAYSMLQPVLKNGMNLSICEGKRIVGVAQLLNYSYQAA